MGCGVERWAVNISTWYPSIQEFDKCLSLLPCQEHSSITRFAKLEDKKAALISRVLQYMLVHGVLGIPYDEIVIKRSEHGKPYVANKSQNGQFPYFNFNTSHHGNYVAIASEPLCLVGIDVMSPENSERGQVMDLLNNFTSCFTTYEWINILDAGPTEKDVWSQFCRYWCLKESYVKAIGIGVGFHLSRLEFSFPENKKWSNCANLRIDGQEQKDWSFSFYQLDNQHWASVAKGPLQAAFSSSREIKMHLEFHDKTDEHGHGLQSKAFTLLDIHDIISQWFSSK